MAETLTMADMYPPFSFNEIAPAYADHFRIHSDTGPKVENPEVVISTSLYWGVRQPTEPLPELSPAALMSRGITGKKDSKRTWWQTYLNPLIVGAHQKVHSSWEKRVYLARNMEFLKDVLPGVLRIIVMEESCGVSMPGMLWRYMPLMEDTLCVARGADNYPLGDKLHAMVKDGVKTQAALVRHTFEPELGPGSKFIYRAVSGSCCVRGPLPFLENATNWLRVNREEPEILSRTFAGIQHTGMHRWDAFSQDEQFLNRWLYHDVVRRQGKVITEPRPNRNGRFYKMDEAFLMSAGCEHHVFYP
jgi:hypothetical protein